MSHQYLSQDEFIRVEGLSKRFGAFYALNDIDLSIAKGEIRGFVGENGAGKSTLIKILAGVYQKSGGEIFISGIPVDIPNPVKSREYGISVIHQERNIIPSFSAVENIYLPIRAPRKAGIFPDTKAMKKSVSDLMDEYGISIPLEKPASMMTQSEKTMLEILRALLYRSCLIIMDEPTASLTDKEASKLFSAMKRVNETGTAILYVSHRLDEVLSIVDSITVMRNGEIVTTVNSKDTDKDGLVSLMSDACISHKEKKESTKVLPCLSVRDLESTDGCVKGVSLEAPIGEITGLFGLEGSGRSETLETIFGIRTMKGGLIAIDGRAYERPAPVKSIKRRIMLIYEDRRGHSLVLDSSVAGNMTLSSIDAFSRFGFCKAKDERKAVEAKCAELDIKMRSIKQRVRELSGGNQQKVVFARAMLSDARVLLCDEPTQAVDVKTRGEIHALLRHFADAGGSVVLVSSDIKEMLEIADTITIISSGRSWETLRNDSLTAETILSFCYKERAI